MSFISLPLLFFLFLYQVLRFNACRSLFHARQSVLAEGFWQGDEECQSRWVEAQRSLTNWRGARGPRTWGRPNYTRPLHKIERGPCTSRLQFVFYTVIFLSRQRDRTKGNHTPFSTVFHTVRQIGLVSGYGKGKSESQHETMAAFSPEDERRGSELWERT